MAFDDTPIESSARIMLVQDPSEERLRVVLALRRALPGAEIEEVGDPETMARLLESSPIDLVITDHSFAGTSGLDVFREVQKRAPECPVILLSLVDDDGLAVRAMQAGIGDCVGKETRELRRLPTAVRSALERSRERRRARQAEAQSLQFFDRAPIGLYRTSPGGEILAANPAFARILGYDDSQDVLGKSVREFYFDMNERQEWLRRIERSGGVVEGAEMRFRRRDARIVWVRNSSQVVRGSDGGVLFYEGAIQDVTAEKRSAEAIREGEDRYRLLVESSPMGVVVHAGGKIQYVNTAGVALIGARGPEDLLGKPVMEFVPPDLRPQVVERIRKANEEGRTLPTAAERLIRVDGRLIDVEVSGAPIVYSGMKAVQLVIHDVTERERARRVLAERVSLAEFAAEVGGGLVERGALQEALRRCAETMVTHLGAAFGRIWVHEESTDTLVLHASAGMYTRIDGLYGRVPVGSFKIGRIARDRKPHLTNHVVGDPEVGDQEWARREGMVAFAGYPLIVHDRLVGVMAMFSRKELSDATLHSLAAVANSIALGIERHRQEEALEAALHRAEESDRLKSAFLANMSHEIRTPLNVILGYGELLRESLGPSAGPAERDLFDGIQAGSDRLINMVTGILDLSRLETGTFECHVEPLQLQAVAEERVEAFRPAAARKKLLLSFESEEPDAIVFFDEYCLSGALSQLLDNAIKFTARGEVRVRQFRTGEGVVALEIRDTGVGIDPSFQASVFHPFSQEQVGYSRGFEGPGIGLALAKGFLGLNGARIELESRKDQGATFRILFSDSPDGPARSAARRPTGPPRR